MSNNSIKIIARTILTFDIKTITGLHIGGIPGTLAIGNVDNPVIRNPFNNQPYVPGSSLRGKMRSQLEKIAGKPLTKDIGSGVQVRIHECQNADDYAECAVCRCFGVAPVRDQQSFAEASRLILRDANLHPDDAVTLQNLKTDLQYTEVKWETAIDRVTSAATPRQQERVPAGVRFTGGLSFTMYKSKDFDLFDTVIQGLQLVEEDYLGGQGARGSGQVRFENITLRAQRGGEYVGEPRIVESVAELKTAWHELRGTLQ